MSEENKKKPDADNPFSEEMPSVTRLLNRKSLKSGQTGTTTIPPKPGSTPKSPAKKPPPAPPPFKKPPPGGNGPKK